MKQPEIHTFGFNHIVDVENRLLDNGVALQLIPLEDTQVVVIDFYFHACKWHQRRSLQAYSSVALIHTSTDDYDADTLAQVIDYNGASIYTRTGFLGTSVTLVCLSKNLKAMMPVMKSIITQPTYDKRRFETFIEKEKQEHSIMRKDVNSVAFFNLLNMLYGKTHPSTSFAEKEDYNTLTREDLLEFHDNYICSSDCRIWMTGDISEENIQLVNTYFGSHKWGKTQFVFQTPHWPEVNPSKENVLRINMEGVQSAIAMGQLLPRWDHPDFTHIMVATTLLGGYFGSRLMSNIREEKGLTYGIQASLRRTLSETSLIISTATANENVEQVVEEVKKEIVRMKTEKVGEDELTRVKNYMIGYACRTYEPRPGLSNLLMDLYMMGKPYDDVITENKMVRETSADDIIETVNRYFDVENMKMCVAGNNQ